MLDSASGPLHVRGKIDRIDRERSLLVLRDLKTGTGKSRRPDDPPDARTDLQLALYARVARVMAPQWKTPKRVRVSYVYTRRGVPERGWAGADFEQLDAATDEWLATAVEVLQQRTFVRSPEDEDCRFCTYGAVCGPELEGRAAVIADARVPRRLRVLKAGEGA